MVAFSGWESPKAPLSKKFGRPFAPAVSGEILMRSAAPTPVSGQVVSHIPVQINKGGHFVDADAALVSPLRAGDTSAFEVLVRRHQGRLFRVALKITNNREDAEDAVQDAFLNAFKHLGNFRGDSQLITWLTSITINQALMAMRAKPRKAISLDEGRKTEGGAIAYEIPAGGHSPEQLCSQREFERLLFARTAGMSKLLRQVWQLHTVEDLADKEIAQVLRLTLTTVKSRLFRARRELRKRMEEPITSADPWQMAVI